MDAEGIDHLKMMNVVRESGAAVEKVWNAFDQLVIFYRARDVVWKLNVLMRKEAIHFCYFSTLKAIAKRTSNKFNLALVTSGSTGLVVMGGE